MHLLVSGVVPYHNNLKLVLYFIACCQKHRNGASVINTWFWQSVADSLVLLKRMIHCGEQLFLVS